MKWHYWKILYTFLDLDIILLKTISLILPLVDIFLKTWYLKAWKCQQYIFWFRESGRNVSILQKCHAYFKWSYYYIRIYIFVISSTFRLPNNCFSKYHLIYFAGSGLGLIILKWNDINELTITDLIVRNHWVLSERILSPMMLEYLASKNPHYYNTIPVESIIMTRQLDGNPMEITDCMK